jgi:hypothetical protein
MSSQSDITPAGGWKIPVLVVDSESSPVLKSFLKLDPPPLIEIENDIYFRDGNLIKVPGLPKELDSISHLSRSGDSFNR